MIRILDVLLLMMVELVCILNQVCESRWVGQRAANFLMFYDVDIQADCRIRDTKMPPNGGQPRCPESPEELAKARMQMSALVCKLLQTSQVSVPEKGRRLQ